MITKEQALEALDNMDDYAQMAVSIDPIGARETLRKFIEEQPVAQPSAQGLQSVLAEMKEMVRTFGWSCKETGIRADDETAEMIQDWIDALSAPSAQVPEPFVVKHYTGEDNPSIKGNGFDGLEIAATREDAERFIAFVNSAMLNQPQEG